MSSGSFMQKYVRCPFYNKNDEDNRRIVCEGISPNSSIEQRFGSVQEYRLQMEVFCCENFKNCEIYEVVMRKYED